MLVFISNDHSHYQSLQDHIRIFSQSALTKRELSLSDRILLIFSTLEIIYLILIILSTYFHLNLNNFAFKGIT